MSDKAGYSFRIVNGTALGAAVTRLGHGRWSVTDTASGRADAGLSAEFSQNLARNADGLLWTVSEDLAGQTVLTLPPLKGKELERAVLGWVAREEGGSPDDWNITWNALPMTKDQSGEPRQRVFTLFAKSDDLNAALDEQTVMPVMPAHALPPSQVLDRFYRLTRDDKEPGSTWSLVFISSEENFLVISNQDSLLLTRGLPNDLSGGQDLQQYIDRLATEIQRSGFFIRQGDHMPEVERIVVAGDRTLSNLLVTRLSSEEGAPAHFWNMEEHFDLQGRTLDPGLLISLAAAAQARGDFPYDLMPRPKRVLFSSGHRRRALVAAGAVGAALLPILLVGGLVTARVQEDYLKKAQQRLEIARVAAQDAADVYKKQRLMLARQNHLQAFRGMRPDLESVLLQMGALAPAEINFRDLRIKELENGSTRVTITGESVARTSAQAQEAFLRFKSSLEDSPFLQAFGEPLKLEISGSTLPGQTLRKTVFKMNFRLVTNGQAKG
jgi:hypothetical protein